MFVGVGSLLHCDAEGGQSWCKPRSHRSWVGAKTMYWSDDLERHGVVHALTKTMCWSNKPEKHVVVHDLKRYIVVAAVHDLEKHRSKPNSKLFAQPEAINTFCESQSIDLRQSSLPAYTTIEI